MRAGQLRAQQPADTRIGQAHTPKPLQRADAATCIRRNAPARAQPDTSQAAPEATPRTPQLRLQRFRDSDYVERAKEEAALISQRYREKVCTIKRSSTVSCVRDATSCSLTGHACSQVSKKKEGRRRTKLEKGAQRDSNASEVAASRFARKASVSDVDGFDQRDLEQHILRTGDTGNPARGANLYCDQTEPQWFAVKVEDLTYRRPTVLVRRTGKAKTSYSEASAGVHSVSCIFKSLTSFCGTLQAYRTSVGDSLEHHLRLPVQKAAVYTIV